MPGAEHEDGGATAQAPVLTSDGEEDGQAALPSPLRASLFAVVERELVRTARRWQTFALRVVFAAVLLGFVALYWSEEVSRMRELDRQSLAQAGRVIFMIYVWTQWMALAALTPILVAQSVIEEREGGTNETHRATSRRRPNQTRGTTRGPGTWGHRPACTA